MSALVITPELERCMTKEQGVVTLPIEDALASCACVGRSQSGGAFCKGLALSSLPLAARKLEQHLMVMGDRFRDRLRVRGYEPASSQLWVHGPFPSYQFNERLADVESAMWREAERRGERYSGDEWGHPELTLAQVFDRDRAFHAYVDYVFLGWFIRAEQVTRVRNQATGDRSPFQSLGVVST